MDLISVLMGKFLEELKGQVEDRSSKRKPICVVIEN